MEITAVYKKMMSYFKKREILQNAYKEFLNPRAVNIQANNIFQIILQGGNLYTNIENI